MIFSGLFVVDDTAPTGSYTDGHTLSLHDALPILPRSKSFSLVVRSRSARSRLIAGWEMRRISAARVVVPQAMTVRKASIWRKFIDNPTYITFLHNYRGS